MKQNMTKLLGVVIVAVCSLFSFFALYLWITSQGVLGGGYTIFSVCIWFIMALYFGNEVRKEFKKEIE